jgi:hypothetical protein
LKFVAISGTIISDWKVVNTMSDETQETLTDKQRLAIVWLVQGLTDGEVAEKVGCSRETVNRWKSGNDAFKVALNDARAKAVGDSLIRLQLLVSDAVTVLEGSVKSADADHKVAVAILKAVGVYGTAGLPGGPRTLEELENWRRRDEMRRIMDAAF